MRPVLLSAGQLVAELGRGRVNARKTQELFFNRSQLLMSKAPVERLPVGARCCGTHLHPVLFEGGVEGVDLKSAGDSPEEIASGDARAVGHEVAEGGLAVCCELLRLGSQPP